MRAETPSVLLIYTGGTIGMIENPETGALENFNFDHLLKHVPELKKIQLPHLFLSVRPAYRLFRYGTFPLGKDCKNHQLQLRQFRRLRHPARNGYNGLHCFRIKFYARRTR